MKKKLKMSVRFLAYLAGALLVLKLLLVLVFGATLLWVNRNPHSIFEIAEKYLLPDDMKINWSNLKFHVRPISFTEFSLDLSLDNLRVTKRAPALDLPIEQAHIRALLFPFKRKVSVELLEVRSALPITYKSEPQAPEHESDSLETARRGIRILHNLGKYIVFDAIHVDIKEIKLQRPAGSPIASAFRLVKTKDASAKFNLKLESPPELNVIAAGEILADGSAFTLMTNAEIKYRDSKLKLTILPKLSVHLKDHDANVDLILSANGIPGPLTEVTDIRANLRTSLASADKLKASAFSIAAPVRLFFVNRPNRAVLERACSCKLPELLEVKASGDVYLDGLLGRPSDSRLKVLESKIAIETLENKIIAINLKGGLRAELETVIQNAERKKKFFFYPHLDCSATIRSFKSLKTLLDVNGILVPAPFDVMDGSLQFNAIGPVETDANGSKFPLDLLVDIKSKGQDVKSEIHADVTVNSQFTEAHLDVKTKISSLMLDLPPLKPLDGIPHVTADSRFKKEPVRNRSVPKFKVSFNFEVETEAPTAIRLKLHYFTPYLPLNLKIQSETGRENTGFIALQPFDITYLRRTVHVEYLTLKLAGTESEPMPVKGRFRIKQTEYTIFIDVEGNSKNPFVVFSSEPYLSKDEIIHVLLFDRRSDLQPGEAETSGNVQAALADRAMGLFGLWAFASTPIKSFIYNPVTKVYSATIAVSDDLTVGIGTGWESATHLELRKRVSRNWNLTAVWTPATQDEKDTAKLVLQWEKRF